MWFKQGFAVTLIIVVAAFILAAVTTQATTPNEATAQIEMEMEVILDEGAWEEEIFIINTEPELLPVPIMGRLEYEEKYPEVPNYFQTDYLYTPYGNHGTIASHGCGITSLAMVLTYLLDKEILPDYLASKYGHYNTESGSSYLLFPDSAEDYGVTVEKMTSTWSDVVTALENGQVVIALARSHSVFTDAGHLIVLSGITEDGKVLVNDPNGHNYRNKGKVLTDGFANGFDQKYIKSGCYPFWIYAPKDLDAIAAQFVKEIKYTPIAFDLQTV